MDRTSSRSRGRCGVGGDRHGHVDIAGEAHLPASRRRQTTDDRETRACFARIADEVTQSAGKLHSAQCPPELNGQEFEAP
jgi:hypothetical protein